MWYASNSDHMANSYYVIHLTLKWTRKLFFHFLDLTVLSRWILLSLCGTDCAHRVSDFVMVWNVIVEARRSQDRCTLVLFNKTDFGGNKCYKT